MAALIPGAPGRDNPHGIHLKIGKTWEHIYNILYTIYNVGRQLVAYCELIFFQNY